MSLLHFIMINTYLAIFYGLFILLSKNKTHFGINRLYLLVMPVVSIFLPFVIGKVEGVSGDRIFFHSEMEVFKEINVLEVSEGINWQTLIFILGLTVSLFFVLFQLFHLFKKSESEFYRRYKKYKVYLLLSNKESYSFFGKIYLNKNQLESEDVILEHEYAHCKGYHSIDNIFLAFIKGLFWFNPIIYLWTIKVKENHEFIADNHVLKMQISAKEYGQHLLINSLNTKSQFIVNAFNSKSTIIKRIEKFNHKNQYNMKQLIIVPALVGMTFISVSLNTTDVKEITKNTELVLVVENDSDPKFPGGEDALLDFFNKNFEYPKDAIERKSEGKVYVQFTVDVLGELNNVKVLRGAKDDALNKAAIDFVKKMPNWVPAIKNGEKVSAEVVFPINFTLN